MAFSRFRHLASMKLKDAKSSVESIKSVIGKPFVKQKGFLNSYNEKYIQTGSVRPLNDVLIYVFILSYGVGWPTEMRHLKHAEEQAKHGKKKH